MEEDRPLYRRGTRRTFADWAIIHENWEWDIVGRQPTREEMLRIILEKVAEKPDNRAIVVIRGLDENGDIKKFRSITNNFQTFEEISNLFEMEGFGEDILTFEDIYAEMGYKLDPRLNDLRVDYSWFGIRTVFTPAGGRIPKGMPKRKSFESRDILMHGFMCRDYTAKKDNKNNCLIDCFVYKYGGKKSIWVRKNILKEPLDIKLHFKHISILEKYYGVKARVIIGSHTNISPIENGDLKDCKKENLLKFKTNTTYEEISLYGPNEADIWLMLEDEHYTLVLKRLDNKRCPHTGLALSGGPMKRASYPKIRKELVRQGRLIMGPKGKIKKKKVKTLKPKVYWGFDLESRNNWEGYVGTYAAAAIKITTAYEEEMRGLISKYEDVYGHKPKNLKELKFMFPRFRRGLQTITALERSFFDMSELSLGRMTSFLYDNRDLEDDNILFSYNGSRFDNMLLLNYLIGTDSISPRGIFRAGNSLLGLNFDSFRSFDLARFIPGSLKNACLDFQCKEQKGELDHDMIQNIYNMNGKDFYATMWKEQGKGLKEYNIKDCTSMAELMFKFKDTIWKLWPGANIEGSMTLPGMANKLWRWTLEKGDVCSAEFRCIWDLFRKAAYAGRSEIFQFGHFRGIFQSWDVKSMYPYVMYYCDFPVGQEVYTPIYIPGKLGIYNVKIVSQPKLNIIPMKIKDLPYNWKSEESFDCVICSVDIEMILAYGGEVDIKGGYYWEKSSKDIFRKFIEPFMIEKGLQDGYKAEIKELSKKDPKEFTTVDGKLWVISERLMYLVRYKYNPAIRMICKYFLNSLSGKVIQKIYLSECSLCLKKDEVLKFMGSHVDATVETLGKGDGVFMRGEKEGLNYKPNNVSPCHLGVFIYAWSRAHLYQAALSKMPGRMATDTDSVHLRMCECPNGKKGAHIQNICNLPLWETIEPKVQPKSEKGYKSVFGTFVLGGEFGMFDPEISFPTRDVYYIAPKCYALYSDAPHIHTERCYKGCKQTHMEKVKCKGVKGRDKLSILSKDQHDALNYVEQFDECRTLKPGLSEDMFRSLTNGENVGLICQQIRKIEEDGFGGIFRLKCMYLYKNIAPCGTVTVI